jgi:hypothetical protein
MSSNSSSASANIKSSNDVKVANGVPCYLTNCFCFSLSSLFLVSFQSHHPILRPSPLPTQPNPEPSPLGREEFSSLQANVEFLSNRINSATSVEKPLDAYKYESPHATVDATDTALAPNLSAHSSPQNYANLSQSEHKVDDNANYALTNVAPVENSSRPLTRSSSKYVEDEPYYAETPEQPSYYEPQGNESSLSLPLH